ncbi:transposase [Streptomyces sp. NBC_00151]|uniref:transposase n=1 Tax=Streptomyces sp. NBC_00151 TaxID=2975669 RepID=UPI00308F0988|nr:transposase [Streptomyces sp. NBC_00151]
MFCHVYGRASDQLVPGWPYSFVAALESGRTSWCQLLDAVRLGPADDAAEVTASQLRYVVEDLIHQERWRPGDPDILIVCDAGYDAPRLAYLLDDLPIEVLGPRDAPACHAHHRAAARRPDPQARPGVPPGQVGKLG